MSWRAKFQTVKDGPYDGNAVRFATFQEAGYHAKRKAMKWTSVKNWLVMSSDDPVTYTCDIDGNLERITDGNSLEDCDR